MERYVTGLLSDLPHKTCETIAEVIAGTSLERLQHLLTDAAWDPLTLDEARVKQLLELHPVSDGILVFDDTGLPKKGSGAARSGASILRDARQNWQRPSWSSAQSTWPMIRRAALRSTGRSVPACFTRVLDPGCRASQAGASARGGQPANETRDCSLLAGSCTAMGRASSGGGGGCRLWR
jgi:hypothetical protein